MRTAEIIRNAGGEVSNARAAFLVDPQAAQQARRIAAVTEALAAVTEQIVAAADAIAAGQVFHRQPVTTEEAAARGFVFFAGRAVVAVAR